MSKDQNTFTAGELTIIGNALETYKNEVKKLMTKSEALGLMAEANDHKKTFLSVEALRGKVAEM